MTSGSIDDDLIQLCLQIEAIKQCMTLQALTQRDLLLEQVQLIGKTAACFGGFDGMTKLHNACETTTGCTNAIGSVLKVAWGQDRQLV